MGVLDNYGSQDLLREQLAHCALRNPDLAARLSGPALDAHLLSVEGTLVRRIHRRSCAVDPGPAEIAPWVSSVAGVKDLLLFGIGGGALLPALFEADPQRRITAWDRDPNLIRACLLQQDLRSALRTGRLDLRLGIDLLDLDPRTPRLDHPQMAPLYRREKKLLESQQRPPLALLHDGGLFVDDAERALRARGFGVYTIDSTHLSQDELLLCAKRSGAEVLVTINHFPGIDAFASAAGLKAVAWEIDPNPHFPQPASAPDSYHLFSWREANLPRFEEQGFRNSHFLPLAADPKRRHPPKTGMSGTRRLVSFVGASLQDEATRFSKGLLEAWIDLSGAPPQEASWRFEDVCATQERDLFHNRMPELVAQAFPELRRRPEIDWAMVASQRPAASKRRRLVQILAEFEIEVWGDAGWRGLHGVHYGGRYARHESELTRIFGESLINLDIGRLYQEDIVTMRVFDVLACGGFLLTQDSAALRDLFEVGSELEVYRSEAELVEKVAWFLDHPAEARAIGERGRAAILERHTMAQRWEEIFRVAEVEVPAAAAAI